MSSRQRPYAMFGGQPCRGSTDSNSPSRIRTRIGSPQSKQGQSIRTSCLGKSQQTASDSILTGRTSVVVSRTVIKYWVGKLANGANDSM